MRSGWPPLCLPHPSLPLETSMHLCSFPYTEMGHSSLYTSLCSVIFFNFVVVCNPCIFFFCPSLLQLSSPFVDLQSLFELKPHSKATFPRDTMTILSLGIQSLSVGRIPWVIALWYYHRSCDSCSLFFSLHPDVLLLLLRALPACRCCVGFLLELSAAVCEQRRQRMSKGSLHLGCATLWHHVFISVAHMSVQLLAFEWLVWLREERLPQLAHCGIMQQLRPLLPTTSSLAAFLGWEAHKCHVSFGATCPVAPWGHSRGSSRLSPRLPSVITGPLKRPWRTVARRPREIYTALGARGMLASSQPSPLILAQILRSLAGVSHDL